MDEYIEDSNQLATVISEATKTAAFFNKQVCAVSTLVVVVACSVLSLNTVLYAFACILSEELKYSCVSVCVCWRWRVFQQVCFFLVAKFALCVFLSVGGDGGLAVHRLLHSKEASIYADAVS